MWAAIHSVCLGAPEQMDPMQQLAYVAFFRQLPYVIPCGECAQHLLENLDRVPVPIEQAVKGGGAQLFAWSVDLHNAVNRMLGKKEVSLQHAKKQWQQRMSASARTTCGRQQVIALAVCGLVAAALVTAAFVSVRSISTRQSR